MAVETERERVLHNMTIHAYATDLPDTCSTQWNISSAMITKHWLDALSEIRLAFTRR